MIVFYDSIGTVFLTIEGDSNKPNGNISYLDFEVPEGKIFKGIDVTQIPNTPIYGDNPTPEIDILKQQLKENQELITEYVNNKYNALLNY
jgi:hypothetical protein